MSDLAYQIAYPDYLNQWSVMEDLSACSYQIRRAVHELAQPLAVLAGAVDLLLYETGAQPESTPELLQVNQCVQQIIDLVNDLRRLILRLQEPRPDN